MEGYLQKGIGCCIVLCQLSLAAHFASAQGLDARLLRSINSGRNTGSDQLALAVTHSTYPIAIGGSAAIIAYGVATHRPELWRAGATAVLALGVNYATTASMKAIVQRPRPYATYSFVVPYEREGSYSLPSGHTSTAFATATSVSLYAKKWYVTVPAYTWASAVAYSRVRLGVHYPTDVAIGALLGAGSAWLAYKGNVWLRKKSMPIEH
jgi:membrane-associated phospholipid phosphatase